MDFVLKITDEKTAIAGFAAFGLTNVDGQGKRSIRQGGLTSKVDMETLAEAVIATQDLVQREVAKGTSRDAALVEAKRIIPLTAKKPVLDTKEKFEIYRRDLTEWCTVTVGERMLPTGATETDPFGNERPVMAADGFYYIVLRWNGDAMLPPMPPGFEIIWSSASPGVDDKGFPLPAPEYPAGLPRFA